MRKDILRKGLVFMTICFLMYAAVLPHIITNVEADLGDVVYEIPSPGYGTSGLTWDGNYLWSDNSVLDKIFKIDPMDGVIINSYDSPGDGARGLTWDGTYLWNSDTDVDKIFKLNPSDCSIVDSFDSPGDDPRDLCWDGTYLWNANAHNSKIYKLNPSDGSIIFSFDSPTSSPLGLAWDGIKIWSSSSVSQKIYAHNPSDGNVIVSFDSPGNAPCGLACEENYLWNIDMLDDKIYKIDINEPPNTPTIEGPTSGNWLLSHQWNFTASDPNGDDIFYYVEWGDGEYIGWSLAYNSGETMPRSHKYNAKGTYTIQVKAKDIYGLESEWGYLTVTMPCSYNIPMQWFWDRLFQKFPNVFPILRHLMGY